MIYSKRGSVLHVNLFNSAPQNVGVEFYCKVFQRVPAVKCQILAGPT